MNSSKTVLDASLLEAMYNTIQYSRVQSSLICFSVCCRGVVLLISEWVLIHHELWDVFQVCVYHRPNWLLTVETQILHWLPAKTASQTAQRKVIRAKKYPKIYSKKIMAAMCSHFSNKADLILVVFRCNNPEIPYFTACTACHPDPDVPRKRIVWKIHILFSLMCYEDPMIHLTSYKMRNANG